MTPGPRVPMAQGSQGPGSRVPGSYGPGVPMALRTLRAMVTRDTEPRSCFVALYERFMGARVFFLSLFNKKQNATKEQGFKGL